MKTRIVTFAACMLTICLLLPLGTQANQTISASSANVLNTRPLSERRVVSEGRPIDLRTTSHSSGFNRVVIELSDAPAVQAFALANQKSIASDAAAATKAQVARIETAQQALLKPLAQLNATVLYRTQRVYNGIAVEIAESKLASLLNLPGVKAIHPLVSYHLANSTSVPFIGAPELWNKNGVNVTGKGIKVGIIDTGIDYIHTDFGGSGSPADYARNITDTITESPALFPTAKVVGGFDFVGDDYDASSTSSARRIPHPDADPEDCNDHGTHVAGTVAGYGVNANGTTYTGLYSSTLNFSQFKVGPGVAPEASLYALRIFGCDGTAPSDQIAAAIEYAVDPNKDGDLSDHLDVINMSLGSSSSSGDDTQSVASNNAALAGVAVVAAAGNDGDAYYITGGPGNADRTLTVASSVDNGQSFLGVKVISPAAIAGTYQAAAAGFGPPLSATGITNSLALAQDPSDEDGPSTTDGCSPLTNAADVSGKIAVIDRGTCDFVTKVRNAQTAGAIAVIIVNNRPGDPTSPGGNGTEEDITIPSVMITQSNGATIKQNLPTPGVEIALSSSITVGRPDLANTLSDFSSRGPGHPGSGLKPDIAAPGQSITSAKQGSGSDSLTISGTSMASPHVAGSMALLKQLHPTWTVEELKALAMNTATTDLRTAIDITSQTYGPGRIGAGRITLPNAANDNVIAYVGDNSGRVSVSFGALEVTNTVTLVKNIRVANKGAQPATYNVAYVPSAAIPGVNYSIAPASVTIAANTTADIAVTMTADPAAMKHTHDPSITETQSGLDRHWLSEATGYVTLTPPITTLTTVVNGANETPPTPSAIIGNATFVYTATTQQLGYRITFNQQATFTMGHLHRGLPGVAGPVAVPFFSGTQTFGPGNPLQGALTLTPADAKLLLEGALYANFHTQAFPAGEVRGQVLPTAAPFLRVPIYTAARPAAQMKATQTNLSFTGSLTGTKTIGLAGQGLSGTDVPTDELSIVTTFELQHTSPLSTTTEGSDADLQYVGVASNIRASATITEPTGIISSTEVYFGLSTYADWASPHQVEFDIYIDTNRDGTDDYLLSEWNAGSASGGALSDTYITVLTDLTTGDSFLEDFLNGVPASVADTVPFNTNVMVLPVLASDLGLTAGKTSFNYHIVTYSSDRSNGEFQDDLALYGDMVDTTPTLTYDAARPGLDLTNPGADAANAGFAGLPAYPDLPGITISVNYDANNYAAGNSKGVLLLHHHNTRGNRAEVVAFPGNERILLPLIAK